MAWVFIGVGLVLLLAGSGALVRGSVGLFRAVGISPLLASLIVVSAAVSAPELFVSLLSGIRGHVSVPLGMLIGSSLANLLLVMGVGAILGPMPVPPKVVFRDGGVMILASGALAFLAGRGTIDAPIGVALLACFLIYIFLCFLTERRRHVPVPAASAYAMPHDAPPEKSAPAISLLLFLGGLGALFFGARFVIDAGLAVARQNGIPDAVAGLVLIGAAVALPELGMAIAAAARRQSQATASQLLASSVFNLTFVLGVLALVTPIHVDADYARTDVFVLLGAAVAVPILAAGWRITRLRGFVLIAGYMGWLGFIAWRTGLLPFAG